MKDSTYKKAFSEIIKQFTGLKKVEAFDLISKLETLLFYAPNPLQFEDIDTLEITHFKNGIDIDPFQFTVLPNGNFAELVGCNDFIHVYKEYRRVLPNWKLFNSYYFTSKHFPLEFSKLTKKNILTQFEGMEEERKLKHFIKYYKVSKTDPISKKLLILDV